jgi:hypothetical protein
VEGELAGMEAAVEVGEVLDGTGFEGHEGLGEGGQLTRVRRRMDKGISYHNRRVGERSGSRVGRRVATDGKTVPVWVVGPPTRASIENNLQY